MFGWFESRLNAYPVEEPTVPPQGLFAFCWHYTKPAAPWLLTMSVCTMLIAIGEVALFQFLGNVVDWLSSAKQDTFLASEGTQTVLDGRAHPDRPADWSSLLIRSSCTRSCSAIIR
jgi:ATP-binding cassette subfamily B multidrug efflux pump